MGVGREMLADMERRGLPVRRDPPATPVTVVLAIRCEICSTVYAGVQQGGADDSLTLFGMVDEEGPLDDPVRGVRLECCGVVETTTNARLVAMAKDASRTTMRAPRAPAR